MHNYLPFPPAPLPPGVDQEAVPYRKVGNRVGNEFQKKKQGAEISF